MILRVLAGQFLPPLSEKADRIETIPSAPKLVQVIMRRPVSGSTSMNSLSAASNRLKGFVAARTSNGPVHVWPQSVERCTPIVCAATVAGFRSEERRVGREGREW